ncbi:MAG: preprotein translocase subunit YajC [Treponema sp.]|jgi:preprotein translocase subunit YajC|nr:preprotein translocase subunit YajC [Treponema sp.]
MKSFAMSLLLGGQQAAAGADGAAPAGNPILQFLPFVAIIAIFYFLIIRPQNKKQKETKRMLEALKKGDKIVTIGGIHGTIQSVKETTVIVKVDDGIKLEFSRSAISNVEAAAAIKEEKEEKHEKIEEKKEEDSAETSSDGAKE